MTTEQLYRSLCAVLLIITASIAVASDPFAELDKAVNYQTKSKVNELSEFEAYKKAERQRFQAYMEKVQKEFEMYKKIHQHAVNSYKKELSSVWKEPEISSQKKWVMYNNDNIEKTVIDFDKGEIKILSPKASSQSVDDKQLKSKLINLLQLTRKQAFEKDVIAQRVEIQGRKNLDTFETDQVSDDPVLWSYLFGNETVGKQETTILINAFMNHRKKVQSDDSGQQVIGWKFPLNPIDQTNLDSSKDLLAEAKAKENAPSTPTKAQTTSQDQTAFVYNSDSNIWKTKRTDTRHSQNLPKKAIGLLEAINRENQKFNLSVELVLAIIETESAFNPMAKSPIPAYGLMQIVPESAGQDATAKIFGRPRILAPSYLYNADNNIQVGAAYFNILFYRYFKNIESLRSRLYCAIAAYNTGPGNVAKALTGKSMSLKQATKIANQMNSNDIYNHLMNHLPYKETVHYLEKVTTRLQKYEKALSANKG